MSGALVIDVPQRQSDPLVQATSLMAGFAATAGALDQSGEFPHENFAALQAAGLLALPAPVALGGQGEGLATTAAVIGAIAAGEPSTALILVMQSLNLALLPGGRWPKGLVERVVRDAAQEGALINNLRVEPELGTPVRGGLPATTARRTATGWSLSGRKIYSTGSPGLSWMIVFARTDEEEPRVGQFLVPASAEGIVIEKTWNPLGMRATASHDVVFTDVALPHAFAADLRRPDEWVRGDGPEAVWMAVLIGALYDGIARAARDWLVGFLNARTPSNLGAPLSTVPRIQQAVGEIERLLATNARLIVSAAADTDAGRPPAGAEATLLKLTLTENAIEAVERALKLCGNHGVSRDNPLERHLRNVLCGRIHSPQEDTVLTNAGRLALATPSA